MTFTTRRAYRVAMNERIFRENHLGIDRFFALDQAAYRDGALDTKTKELLGLVASLVLQLQRTACCITWTGCVQEGVSHEQIVETLNIGLIVGGEASSSPICVSPSRCWTNWSRTPGGSP